MTEPKKTKPAKKKSKGQAATLTQVIKSEQLVMIAELKKENAELLIERNTFASAVTRKHISLEKLKAQLDKLTNKGNEVWRLTRQVGSTIWMVSHNEKESMGDIFATGDEAQAEADKRNGNE